MSPWIGAGLVVLGGIVVGALAGWAGRTILSRRSRDEVGDVARPAGTFLFWFFVFLGIVIGVGILTPASLETVPRQVLAFFPRLLVAGLILIGSWAAAAVAGRLVRRGLISASGEPNRGLETAVRLAVLATGFVFAVAQLGIDTAILTILAGVVAGSLGLAFALLVGLGGRRIASEVAAGRYLARHIRVGDRLAWSTGEWVVAALHPASVELAQDDGSRRILPYGRLLDEGIVLMG